MSPLVLLILILIVLYKLWLYVMNKSQNSLPGIPRVPIFGSYLFLLWHNYEYPHKAVIYYANKLKSKIVSCYFGPYFVIIVNDYHGIKEVLGRPEFDGRLSDAQLFKDRAFGRKLGIFFTEGPYWQEQRRFALRHMRDFGFGRRQEKLESIIIEEVSQLIDMLKHGPINDKEKVIVRNGTALFPNVLFPYAFNTIWYIIFGRTFDRPEYNKLIRVCQYAMEFQRAGDTSGGVILQRPFLKYFGDIFAYKSIMRGNYGMVNFIKEYLDDFKVSRNADSDTCFVDRFLNELRQRKEVSTFSEEQLIITLLDFVFPALSALPSTLTHAIKLVMHHPEVMGKVQKEIETVVGTGRFVCWEDRKMLPYTEATMREAMRYETLTPFGVIHKCNQDTVLCGYNVLKDTIIVTNLGAMHEDPEYWGDPQCFRPERFLKEDGSLNKDCTMPFGFGHRLCAGETFARYSMFGVFAVLMQNFNFEFINGEPTSLEDKLPGLIVSPKDVWIQVTPRN
ncbi:hypothetical protein KM043_014445 [Ampulex compressa]|nr:hypothetical protein KM043_014445 [Ampulex compressa]